MNAHPAQAGIKTFFLTFFGHLPIDAAQEVVKMLKDNLIFQAAKYYFYFFSFKGFKVCLKVS